MGGSTAVWEFPIDQGPKAAPYRVSGDPTGTHGTKKKDSQLLARGREPLVLLHPFSTGIHPPNALSSVQSLVVSI